MCWWGMSRTQEQIRAEIASLNEDVQLRVKFGNVPIGRTFFSNSGHIEI